MTENLVTSIIIWFCLVAANPLVLNDDFQTPLDIARVKGYSNVVRAIEVCFLTLLFKKSFLLVMSKIHGIVMSLVTSF